MFQVAAPYDIICKIINTTASNRLYVSYVF